MLQAHDFYLKIGSSLDQGTNLAPMVPQKKAAFRQLRSSANATISTLRKPVWKQRKQIKR